MDKVTKLIAGKKATLPKDLNSYNIPMFKGDTRQNVLSFLITRILSNKWIEYYNEFTDMAEVGLEIGDRVLAQWFVEGLSEETKTAVKLKCGPAGFCTVVEAYQEAKIVDNVFQRKKRKLEQEEIYKVAIHGAAKVELDRARATINALEEKLR